jgi:hypothetical protein
MPTLFHSDSYDLEGKYIEEANKQHYDVSSYEFR